MATKSSGGYSGIPFTPASNKSSSQSSSKQSSSTKNQTSSTNNKEYVVTSSFNVGQWRMGEMKSMEAYDALQKQQSNSGTQGYVSPVPPLPPPPPPPTTVKIKTATPENILWDPTIIPVEILTDLVFEDIGGQELLSLIRHDTVSGDNVSNQLIKNLTFLNQEYSSKNMIGLQNTSDKYFSNFSIKLDSKIPVIGGGPLGSSIYVDSNTQDVIIELVNLEIDERLEVQIGIGGTIYTISLEVIES
jgi:hypothetical protein